MKRVIKFWNKYKQDEGKFSNSGTEYEVLPILVADDAGSKELRAIAKQLGLELKGSAKTAKPVDTWRRQSTEITHFVKLNEKTELKYFAKEVFDWYLGFATLNEKGPLKPLVKPNGKIDLDTANDIINGQHYGVDDVGQFEDGPKKEVTRVIMSGWNYFHEMTLLGYSTDQFQKVMGAKKDSEGRNFHDSVFRCDDCNIYDYQDNGYQTNYRVTDYTMLGTNCGCYDEHCKTNFLSFADKHNEAIELNSAKELETDGKIEFVERFIGGMTDGRGGWYGGESTREGSPEGILKEYKEKEPKSVFLFTHDESGQFQTYFSIWRVTKKGMKQNKRGAA